MDLRVGLWRESHPLRSRAVRCGGCCLRCVCRSMWVMCVKLSLMCATVDGSGAQVLQRFSPRRKAARLSYSSEPHSRVRLEHTISKINPNPTPKPRRRRTPAPPVPHPPTPAEAKTRPPRAPTTKPLPHEDSNTRSKEFSTRRADKDPSPRGHVTTRTQNPPKRMF